MTYPDSTYITYTYDTINRLTYIKDSSSKNIATYTYDGKSSRRKTLTYLNSASIEYTYDALNRIKSLKNKLPSGSAFSSFDYTYDKVGNRLTMTSNEGLHQYFYDDTYQLIDVTYPDSRTAHYEYDDMGNRVYVDERGESLDYALKTNGLNQYDYVTKSSHNIDVKGTVSGTNVNIAVNGVGGKVSGTTFLAEDITLNSGLNTITATATNTAGTAQAGSSVTLNTSYEKSFLYDGNGSLTRVSFAGKQVNYTYDYENRLTNVIASGSEAIYTYDYLGRRITKNIAGTITTYIYDGDNIIAEYNSSGTLTAKYVYGPNIDEPIRLEKGTTICYYHFDGLGSVTDLSNSSGQHVEHYTYSPFGKAKIYDPATGMKRATSSYGNFYMFTGRQWDGESGLYYYRARVYDPNLGRFLQVDPVGHLIGELNLYRYCWNDPINFIDPWGLARIGGRPLSGNIPFNGMGPVRHDQIHYNDGSNSGFFDANNDAGGRIGPDTGHTKDEYDFSRDPKVYDDDTMRQAENNVQNDWDIDWRMPWWNPWDWNNCQDYINAVRDEYERLEREKKKNKGV